MSSNRNENNRGTSNGSQNQRPNESKRGTGNAQNRNPHNPWGSIGSQTPRVSDNFGNARVRVVNNRGSARHGNVGSNAPVNVPPPSVNNSAHFPSLQESIHTTRSSRNSSAVLSVSTQSVPLSPALSTSSQPITETRIVPHGSSVAEVGGFSDFVSQFEAMKKAFSLMVELEKTNRIQSHILGSTVNGLLGSDREKLRMIQEKDKEIADLNRQLQAAKDATLAQLYASQLVLSQPMAYYPIINTVPFNQAGNSNSMNPSDMHATQPVVQMVQTNINPVPLQSEIKSSQPNGQNSVGASHSPHVLSASYTPAVFKPASPSGHPNLRINTQTSPSPRSTG